MRELCPAFLAADFEDAAREAEAAVKRLCALAVRMSSETGGESTGGQPLRAWLEQRPEWRAAQSAVQRQFSARAALEETGLPLPNDAAAAAERAQSDFARLGAALSERQSPHATHQH